MFRPILKDLKAIWVLDSRSNPTLEVFAYIQRKGDIFVDSFIVPSGASTGEYEALELRDNEKDFHGKGVNKAIKNVSFILDHLFNTYVDDIFEVDRKLIELDGTKNKSNLGANATLGVSVAIAKAVAKSYDMPFFKYLSFWTNSFEYYLPVPMMNIINGGLHADNGLDFQEFMIVPLGFEDFANAIKASSEVYNTLKKLLKENGLSVSVGDEGGFAPKIDNPFKACEFIINAIEKSGYKPGKDFYISLDVAASSFFKDNKYIYQKNPIDYKELMNIYDKLISTYPIFSIEDPFDENDWDAFKEFTLKYKNKILIVGDDLFVTNIERIEKGINNNIANAVLIKLNQIGTLSETIKAISLANKNGYKTIISHRSGETEDNTISHIATNNSYFIKTGAPARSERNSKYNELLRIYNFYNLNYYALNLKNISLIND
ncbi:MAG: phosphopyruvate hydratase [bacterium]|jgi:enolase